MRERKRKKCVTISTYYIELEILTGESLLAKLMKSNGTISLTKSFQIYYLKITPRLSWLRAVAAILTHAKTLQTRSVSFMGEHTSQLHRPLPSPDLQPVVISNHFSKRPPQMISHCTSFLLLVPHFISLPKASHCFIGCISNNVLIMF